MMKLFLFITYILFCFVGCTEQSNSTDKVILLGDSVFTNLSSALKEPENVRELTIYVKEQPNYIKSLAKLPNMRKLVLLGEINNLDSVFKELQKVEGLEELEITKAGIKKIPDEVSFLRKLKILSFRENEIETISNEIKELTQLEMLDLSWNKLKSLPDSFCMINKLRVLRIDNNPTILVDSLINCMGGIKSLKELSIYGNNIKSINANMCHLYSLKSLNIEKNQITTLPGEIACLTNLEKMYIGGNEISDIEKKRIKTALPKCDVKYELFLE